MDQRTPDSPAPENDAAPARPKAPAPTKITAEIVGYRQLSPTEQSLMNDVKEEGVVVEAMLERVLTALPPDAAADGRCAAIARTKFQEAFMWLIRAIAKPTTFAAMLILCSLAAACTGLGGQPVATASMVVYDAADPGAKPDALFRYNGNVLVFWAEAGAGAEVFLPAPSYLPIAGPFFVQGGQMYVRVDNPPYEWHGSASDTLPAQALGAFRPSEIAAWGLAPPSPDA